MIPVVPMITIAINWILAANDVCPRVFPTDVDSLTRLISALDESRNNFGFWFNSFTLLVVIGVAAEVAIVWIDFKKDMREYWQDFALWKKGESGPLHKPIKWHVVVEMAAAMAVAIGVAGELWFERSIGDINTCIQQADNARAHLLEVEAGNAKKSAEGAANAAGKAQGSANAASISAGDAQEKAKAAKKEADTIEFVFSARHVEDVEGLKDDLNKEFKESHLVFTSYWDDEALPLCNQLVDIAKKAEVDPVDKCGEEPFIPGRAPEEDLVIEAPVPGIETFRRITDVFVGRGRVQGPIASIIGFRQSPQLGILVGLQRRYWFASKWPWPYKHKKQAKNKAPAKQ
jgi:hypothetical protein